MPLTNVQGALLVEVILDGANCLQVVRLCRRSNGFMTSLLP